MQSSSRKNTLALLSLAISAFAIGTTEFISVGLLPMISGDLDIPVTMAGLTVTLYALGVMFGAPVLTSLTSSIPRKTLLIAIMLVFIAGNSLAAFSTGFGMLLAARVLSALAHGVFMSIGSTIAADLVPEDRRASAIAAMFTGLTVATVTGVPLGTFIGQQLGWRSAFVGIVAIGIIALAAAWVLVPGQGLRQGERTPLKEQVKLLTSGRLVLAFLITALGYGGTFVVFTYLSPLLHEITGFRESAAALILLLYGIAIAIGNLIGGKAANRRPLPALLAMFAVQAVILLVMMAALPHKTAGLIAVFAMGLFAFMNVPGLQLHVVQLAERYAPKAVDVASAVNIAAFNGGIALGAWLGGMVTDHMGLIHTTWTGAIMVAAAVVLTAWSLLLEKKGSKDEAEAMPAERQTV